MRVKFVDCARRVRFAFVLGPLLFVCGIHFAHSVDCSACIYVCVRAYLRYSSGDIAIYVLGTGLLSICPPLSLVLYSYRHMPIGVGGGE